MKQYFMIPMKLPSLNEYTAAQRSNKYMGAKFKRDIEEAIGWAIKQGKAKGSLTKAEEPVDIVIDFYEKTKRRDVDNIQSSQKFILDAMVKNGILEDDSRRYVKNIYHRVFDSDKDFAVVKIITAGYVRLEMYAHDEDRSE